MGLKFDYTALIGPDRFERRPLVPVVFRNPETGEELEILGLIDSGADGIILNAEFAPVLGLDMNAGKSRSYQGIGGEPILGYDHEVTIRLRDDKNEYRVEVTFLPGLKTACLLGQSGFFENYKISFEYQKGRFELTPLPRGNAATRSR